MSIVNLSELFAKPEVKVALTEIHRALRKALPEGSFGEREEAALAINNEAVRELLQEELQEMADGLGEELLVNGELYKVHEPGTDTYHGLCGPLDVRRATYRKVGERNGPTVVRLEGVSRASVSTRRACPSVRLVPVDVRGFVTACLLEARKSKGG